MKFKDVDINKFSLLKSDDKKPCFVCKENTEYIEFCYEIRCCSKECLKKMDVYYNEKLRQINEV